MRPGRSAVIAPEEVAATDAAARQAGKSFDSRSAKECAVFSKLSAEFVGTFWLVLGGCGSAVLAAAFPDIGIGLLGVSLAFGLTVLSGAYALGPISGGHFNPAVSVGLWAGGRFPAALAVALHRGASPRWRRRRGGALPHRQRARGFQPRRRVRLQRLRRALTGWVFACGGARVRSRDDVHVPDRHSRHHTQTRSQPDSQGSPSASPSH